MKRIVLPALALAAAIVAIIGAGPAGASGALIVDDDMDCKGAQYSTLIAAYNAASDGSEIFVCPGSYSGNFTINKAVKIQGTNARIAPKPQRCWKPGVFTGTSNVDAVVTGTLRVSHDNVSIADLTIDTGGDDGMVVDQGADRLTLSGMVFQNNDTGLALNGDNVSDTFSCFRDNHTGIKSTLGLTNAEITMSYFFQNTISAMDIDGRTHDVSDVLIATNYTSDDEHFLRAWETNMLTLTASHGNTGPTVGDDGDLVQLLDGNTNFELSHNQFDGHSDAGGYFFDSAGGSANSNGFITTAILAYLSGSGIRAVNGGLKSTHITENFIKKDGGDGIALDPASTGNTIDHARLGQNGGIDCNDMTAGPANSWGESVRGQTGTYPGICGPKSAVV